MEANVVVGRCDDELESARPCAPELGEMPFRPAATVFDTGYELPEHREKLLQIINQVRGRDQIVFLEDPHLYLCGGRVATASVSSLVKPYAEGFDAPSIISKMKSSRREAWPRLKYAVGAVCCAGEPLPLPEEQVLLVDSAGCTTFAGLFGNAPPVRADDTLYRYERCMTDEEIMHAWDSPEARNRGTEAHLTIECWANGEPVYQTPELLMALKFMREVLVPNEIVSYGTEIEVYGEREDLAGSVDFVGKKSDGTFVIADWKRSSKLAANVHSNYRKRLASPFSHIDDADVPKYTIQLSAYAYLLQHYCGMTISALVLVNVHPDQEDPFHTFVPYLKAEVELLMQQRRELVARRIAVQALAASQLGNQSTGVGPLSQPQHGLPLCVLSAETAFDAARVTEPKTVDVKYPLERSVHVQPGDVVSKRYALAHSISTEPDLGATETAADALRSVVVEEESEEARQLRNNSVKWTNMMPKEGVRCYRSTANFTSTGGSD